MCRKSAQDLECQVVGMHHPYLGNKICCHFTSSARLHHHIQAKEKDNTLQRTSRCVCDEWVCSKTNGSSRTFYLLPNDETKWRENTFLGWQLFCQIFNNWQLTERKSHQPEADWPGVWPGAVLGGDNCAHLCPAKISCQRERDSA